MSIPKYTNLKIVGDISIEVVTEELPEDAWVYILWGPTGAGKSCVPYIWKFIQALAGDSQDLGISKDQLAGFTQAASAYKLVNVLFKEEGKYRPIYLVDTPGFSDPKISHFGVFGSVSGHYTEFQGPMLPGDTSFRETLFVTPITQTQMPGTKRRTIDTLMEYFQPSKYRTAFTIVTTMWDTLHTESARQRAEASYEQLRDDIFKEFSDMGATTAQFANTRGSALNILDMGPWMSDEETNEDAVVACLWRVLYERIEGCLQRKEVIQAELANQETQTNLELRALLEKNHAENEETLNKFVEEFGNLDFPLPGFEDAHYRLLKSLLGTYIPLTVSARIYILRYQCTRLVRHAKRRGAKWFKPKV